VAPERNRLTGLDVRQMTTTGLYPDGGGLYLQVGPTGTKSWIPRGDHQAQPRSRHVPYRTGVGFGRAISLMPACRRSRIAVLGCHDTDNDVIYIVEAIRLRQMLPIQHVARIKENPCWDAPWTWPHDGNNQSGIESSETYAGV
jgi:hypothetical protein